MSSEELAALGAAEDVATPETAAETPTEGQAHEDQPAEEQSEEEKTETQRRRERRKAQEQRLREDAQEAAKRAQEAESRLQRIRAAASSEQEPKEADYTDAFEYVAAKAVWRQTQGAAQRQAAEVEAELTQHRTEAQRYEAERKAELQGAYVAQMAEARQRYADFDTVVATAARADVVSPQLADMVIESNQPADLAYHLGRNPDVARALSQMPPLAAARELGRIEAQLSRPQPKLKSDAPSPISPVKPAGTAAKDPDKMSASEYRAWREAGGKF